MYHTVRYPRCIDLRELYVAVDGQCMPCCDLSLGATGGPWDLFDKKEWHLDHYHFDIIKGKMDNFTNTIGVSKKSPIKKCSKTCNDSWYNDQKYFHLELSTRCTLACPKCPRTNWPKVSPDNVFKKTDMKWEHIEQLVEGLPKGYSWLFQGSLGDPVFHPRVYDIVKLVDSKNQLFNLTTASPARTVKWWEEFYDCYENPSIVRFSVDGLANTTHMYRVGQDFEKVWEAMKLGAKLGKIIHWQFIPFSFNEHQIRAARKMAEDNGIVFKLTKSNRWSGKKDPLRPKNRRLYLKQRGY